MSNPIYFVRVDNFKDGVLGYYFTNPGNPDVFRVKMKGDFPDKLISNSSISYIVMKEILKRISGGKFATVDPEVLPIKPHPENVVYVLLEGPHSETCVLGVFSSVEEANGFLLRYHDLKDFSTLFSEENGEELQVLHWKGKSNLWEFWLQPEKMNSPSARVISWFGSDQKGS